MEDGFIHVTDYNKITDTIMYLAPNVVLKFNVYLGSENNKYNEYEYYHKEYKFYSKRFGKEQYSVFRRFSFNLTIENTYIDQSITDEKERVVIGINEITMLRLLLKAAMDWFIGSNARPIYATKDGILVLQTMVEARRVMCGDKYLEIEPIVYVNEFENRDFGVRMYLNSETNYIEMPLNRFLGFQYIIDSFNMYESACMLINYMQRPELGTNLTSYSNDIYADEYKEATVKPKQKTGRTIFSQRQKNTDNLE